MKPLELSPNNQAMPRATEHIDDHTWMYILPEECVQHMLSPPWAHVTSTV